jgi:hypothetical protein
VHVLEDFMHKCIQIKGLLGHKNPVPSSDTADIPVFALFYTNMAALRIIEVKTTGAPQYRIMKLCIVRRSLKDVVDVSPLMRFPLALWLGYF